MTPEQIDRLINLLITLGGKAATEGFAIALRRVTYLAVVELTWVLLITVLCGVGLYCANLCWRKHIEHKADRIYDDEWGVGCWAIRIFGIAMWIAVGLGLLQSGLDKLINPEWHAIQMLLGML